MKKIWIVLSVVIVFAVVGSIIVFQNSLDKPEQEQASVSKDIAEEKVAEELEIEDTNQVANEVTSFEQVKENEVVEQEEKIDTPTKKQKNNSGTKKQEINVAPPKTEQKQEPPKVVEEPKPEVPKQEVVKEPEIDHEYERLKAQVEYNTYEECMNAGFKIALTDTVNILGFTPIEIIYKGKVIGYKLRIDYINPMEN